MRTTASQAALFRTAKPWSQRVRYFSSSSVRAGSSKEPLDKNAFANTLLLPKTSFPLRADPSRSEVPFQERTGEALYRWQWKNATGPLWVLHDGPPYANGDLHMGHALNKILKDIINRFHVSLGRKVHYMPGWDCHGLPIENKALQELGQDALTTPPSTIRAAAEASAKREIMSQKEQYRHFGIMADWSTESTYRTLDPLYEMRQLRIFQKMVEKGLIYRHYRPVHYSPSSRSALAEAELVYKDDHISHSVYVTFEIDRKIPIQNHVIQSLVSSESSVRLLVWTTTPWTLTANMGIAVHPDLTYSILRSTGKESGIVIVAKERMIALADILGPYDILGDVQGSDLVDVHYTPIFASLGPPTPSLKVIPASHVTSESGTGLVHCAPAHGAEDYHAFLALGLVSTSKNMTCHVDGAGRFTCDVADVLGDASANVVGQEVLGDGSRAVVELLRKVGALVKVQRIKHRYPYDWKTDKPIIVTATSQWFADLANIKNDALNALKDVSFFPPASRNRLESFVRSRSEWCISRQRVWGVPIPALHRVDSDEAVLDSASLEHILSVIEAKGVSHWWNGPVDDFLPPALREEGRAPSEIWRKGTDTMDVWFDSGTSWSMLSEAALGEGRQFLADLCLEGSDQHRGWFQSQLLTAVGSAPPHAQRVSPYGALITHGMVLDQAGKKMSKSLGNIISPLTVVLGGKDKKKDPAYGADVLRLWAATVEYWRDMSIGPTVLAQAAESMRKIRNSARFMLSNIGDEDSRRNLVRVPREEMGLAERYVTHELYNLEQTALEGYSSYNFPKVVTSLTNFANITLSSLYFDITKDCLYAHAIISPERRAVVTVLEQVLTSMTRVLAPVLPHLAEEIHSSWTSDGSSVFMTKWELLSPRWNDAKAAEDMTQLLRVRSVVLFLLEQARGNKVLKSSLEAEVHIILPSSATETELGELLQREESFLKTLFIVSDACVTDEGSLGTYSPEWLYTDTLPIPGCDQEAVIRVSPAKLHKCPRCWTYTRPAEDTLCRRCSEVVES
ncbi:putative class-I aminoacyl-tRNA synthetase family protein [Lyophyllum shimeji]|uniref:isoleucine--tRNA ligase n=1 Tax=Lyophyllum shimeji TaxID=47721 RepID=A0A9P3PPP2_LYOSH|nr:putative class-I aminoacyl-tRNA synthetase family protein [Lyophyllum shimeji]